MAKRFSARIASTCSRARRKLGDCASVRSEGRLFPLEIEHLAHADERPLGEQVASAVRRLIAEEPGVGLGTRFAGIPGPDPGPFLEGAHGHAPVGAETPDVFPDDVRIDDGAHGGSEDLRILACLSTGPNPPV